MSAAATMSQRQVKVGEYELALNESGVPGAPTILFLHGAGPGATGESNWRGALEAMQDDYYCLAPDVLGFGDSSHPDPAPQGIVPFTQLRVDTLIGLLDELGIDKVRLVGNSMGGLISLSLVRQAPERVESIVLMGSGGAPQPPGPGLAALIGFYDDPTTEAMLNILQTMVYDPTGFGTELGDVATSRLPRALRDDVRRSHLATFDMTTRWGISEDELAAIAQDVLLIHGREDAVLNFADSVYFFEHIPNARLYGIGKCGHWTQIEQQERFIVAIREFFAGRL